MITLRGMCAVAVAAVTAASQAACGADAAEAGPNVTRETIGDTTVIRVTGTAPRFTAQEEVRIGELDGADEYTFGDITDVAVADDGRIYVLDRQALNVRVYSPAGEHLSTFGRAGGGPGEFKQPGGMVFLPDGRLVVRDPGNTRMNIYSPEGAVLTTWPIPGGFFTSAPIYTDRSGNVYTDVIAERDTASGQIKVGLMRMSSDGIVVDTLRRPLSDFQAPTVRAERVSGRSSSRSIATVPFSPTATSTLNRDGEFVGGITDRYAIHMWQEDGKVRRLERDLPPVPVQSAEAQAAMDRTTRNMRNVDPEWKWNGPQPGATKPYFRDVRVAEDGRLWVQISQPANRLPPDPDAPADPGGAPPAERWVEPMVYEVFEEDGTLAGTVTFPERFRPMVVRGDQIWGVLRDDLDVQYVVRLRMQPASSET